LKIFVAAVLSASLAFSCAAAYAGIPAVAVQGPQPVVEGRTGMSGGIPPLVLASIGQCMSLCDGVDGRYGRQARG
jgi:hypothetical protein